MPRLKGITTKQIHAPHWENHEAVVIRSLNTDDEEHIQDQLAEVDVTGKTTAHSGRFKPLTLQRGIVSWTLTDEQGRPMEVSKTSIGSLAKEDSQYIFNEIEKLSSALTDEKKANSSTPSTPGGEAKPK